MANYFYITHREKGRNRAEEMWRDLRNLPIVLEEVTEERILAAARIKDMYSLSYADAFAGALAQELNATVVTGDPEFQHIAPIVNVLWLTPR